LPPLFSKQLLMKDFFKQIAAYLFVIKKDESQPNNINIKLMHGMNRISLLLFLLAAVIVIYRLVKLYW
jgi:hypothetical protein